ncbi:hypothetical protein SRABI66_01827 [Stenotrophomonas lactitubi]|nr:hypothetical protein SRABI66_01827 [Stenotrophomonas lactitubi]
MRGRSILRGTSARRRAEALACECPPAPAVGRHLPLYFARKGLRPAWGDLRWPQESSDLRIWCRKPSLVGAGRGLGKVKEEVTANGRRRGTFAQTPTCPGGAHQFAELPDEGALWNPDARQKKTRQREGSAGSGLHGGRDPCNERGRRASGCCQSHPPCICIDAMQHTPIMRHCNKNHQGTVSGALIPFRSMG